MQHWNKDEGSRTSEILPGYFHYIVRYEVAICVVHILDELLLIMARIWISILVDRVSARGFGGDTFATKSR